MAVTKPLVGDKDKRRARRRHQDRRMRAKALCLAEIVKGSSQFPSPVNVWIRNRNHLASCSCWMCGNPRKYFLERTRQELKAELDEREQLKDTQS